MKTIRNVLIGTLLFCIAHVNCVALACAACYGQSDSPMAKGMNAGIFALLGVIGTVLSAAATFFVFLSRRAAASSKTENTPHS
jgi:hypothetical protein